MRHKPVRCGARDEPVFDAWNGARGQLGARLGEDLLRHFADQLRLLAKMGEEGARFGLDAHPSLPAEMDTTKPPMLGRIPLIGLNI